MTWVDRPGEKSVGPIRDCAASSVMAPMGKQGRGRGKKNPDIVGSVGPPPPRARHPDGAYVTPASRAAIQRAGALPLPIPPQLDARARDEILAILDGYLLTGGGDLDPATFNEPPHPPLFDVARARA